MLGYVDDPKGKKKKGNQKKKKLGMYLFKRAYGFFFLLKLYTLYLDSENFEAVARKLYVNPSTSNSIVRAALATQLQQAARDALLKTVSYIDVCDLEAEADKAFEALSILLGDNEHFFNRPNPGLFDASVFAYTHLILDEGMGWKQNRLARLLRKYDNLVQHRERLVKFF